MVFAGGTSVLAKVGLKSIDSDMGLALRTFVVMIFVTVNYLAFNSANSILGVTQLSTRHVVFLLLSGVTTSLSWIFYYKALKLGNVSYVVTIDKGSIVIAMALSFLFLGEPLTPKILIGGGFVTIGLLVLVLMK